jgi:hypothetical protein
MSQWAVHYFDPQLGREAESRHMSSLEEAVSAAEAYVRQGRVVQFIASPDGKMNWPPIFQVWRSLTLTPC